MRVFELARELGIQSKLIMDKAKEIGLVLTNQLRALTTEEEATLREFFGKAAAAPKVQRKITQKKAAFAPPIDYSAPSAKPPVVEPPKPAPVVEETPEPVEAAAPAAPPEAVAPPVEAEAPPAEPVAPPKPPRPHIQRPTVKIVKHKQPQQIVERPQPPKVDKPAIPPVAARTEKPAPPKMPIPIAKKGGRAETEEEIRARKLKAKPSRGAPKTAEDWELENLRRRQAGATPPPPEINTAAARRPTPVSGRDRGGEGWTGGRSRRGGRRPQQRSSMRQPQAPTARPEKLTITLPVTVKDLSAQLGLKANAIIAKMVQQGTMATINDYLNAAMVETIGMEFGIEVTVHDTMVEQQAAEVSAKQEDRPEDLNPRAPIVTFLGHVDHGKTSLLDAIREANVAAGEAGGITQHIGAYKYEKNGRIVTFLDTPGHEAFTKMRARGANVTDVVVLVVAADDGVMPQTEEAIDHAKAAGVPIVVAVNKIDKPEANPARVRQQLSALGLSPEEWGGDSVFVNVSATTRQGVDDLVEMLSLVAEMRELKANPNKPASGTVLEARVSSQRGPVATLIVRDGTLKRGDLILAGSVYGRVKAMRNDRGRNLSEAGPSQPVEVLGLSETPEAGDSFQVLDDLQKARDIAAMRHEKKRQAALATPSHVTLENLYDSISKGAVKELRLILKTDVQGSIEALDNILRDLGTEEVRVRVLRRGTGPVSTSDVLLADASDAVIVSLHVTADTEAKMLAETRGVDIREYDIIYRAVEEIRAAMEGMLEPEVHEEVRGHAEVRQVFDISRMGIIAGCYITDGVVARNNRVRIFRAGEIVYTGPIHSMRRLKDDIREAREGFECGIKIEGFDEIRVGDRIEAYEVTKVARTLNSPRPQQKG